jgi:hypothetical protein
LGKNILENLDIYKFKDELTNLIKHLRKTNFTVEALNIKVALEAISITDNRGKKGLNNNECILFLSYSNENTIRIAEKNNLNTVVELIKKSKELT